jgi:hypothetical protein
MRRSEAPACVELCAGSVVVTILWDMDAWFRLELRREVSPTSLTDSCVFSGFLDIKVNEALPGSDCR